MRFKKLMAVCLTAVMCLNVLGNTSGASDTVSAATFTDLSQDEIVVEMGAGWNLGNQLEACISGVPYETAWGNPTITENLIKAVKDAGFSTIRVPVSYLSKIGSGSSYTIDSSWLNRIQEVVNMCINNDLYVIINMHGDGYNSVDGGWLLCNGSDQTTIKAKYKACWQQIATKFKDYDEHLIFESMNEEFDGTYGWPNATYYDNINTYNQIFVDTVRQTGGNNDKRWLLIPGWNTNIEYTAGNYGFELPTDSYRSSAISSSEQRIMISVHYYDPWGFCGEESGATTQWGSAATDSSKVASYGDESFMKTQLSNMYSTFVCKGYPVVIGEYGAIDKSAYDSNNLASRVEWTTKLCTYAKSYGCVPVWWDNGYNGTHGFGLFDRNSCTITQQSVIDAIMGVYSSDSSSSGSEGSTEESSPVAPSEEESTEESSSEEPSSTPSASGDKAYTFTSQTNYEVKLRDYIPNVQVGDEVTIKATLKGNTWYGGAICGNSGKNGNISWASSSFSSDGNNNAEATFDMVVPYSSNDTVQVQMWWFGSGSVDLYLDVTRVGEAEEESSTVESSSVEESSEVEESSSVEESSTVEESSEEESSSTSGSTVVSNKYVRTYTSQEEYSFNLNDYVPGIEVGDEVRITADFKGNTYYGGSLGTVAKVNGNTSWVSESYSNDTSNNASVTLDMVVPYEGSNTIYVSMWWMGSGSVDLYITIEKLEEEQCKTGCMEYIHPVKHLVKVSL